MSFTHTISLVLHLLGFAAVSGAVLCDALVHVVFWKTLRASPGQAPALIRLMNALGVVATLGGLLSLASAASLLSPFQFSMLSVSWIQLKVLLFIALTLNGVSFAASRKRRVATATADWVARAPEGNASLPADLLSLERQLSWFHRSEILGVLALVVVAVFKFQ